MTDFATGSLTATATTPTGINNSASQLVLYTVGCGGATFTVPTAAGTVAFFGSGDGGITWMPLAVTPSSGGAPILNSSAAGLWAVNTSAYTHVAVVATAITGGSVSASIHTAPVAGRSGGGGGGPGMVPTGSTGITTFTTTGTSGLASYSSSTGAMNIPNYSIVPAGSTGIVAPITTTGTSGPATYNSVTGALNIPNCVPNGYTFNSLSFVPAAYSTSSTTAVSTNQGVSFVPVTAQTLVTMWVNTTTTPGYIAVYRNTTGIPAAGASAGSDTVVLYVGTNNVVTQYISGAIFDTGLTPGTTYYYYLAIRANTAATINLVAGGKVQVSEFHL